MIRGATYFRDYRNDLNGSDRFFAAEMCITEDKDSNDCYHPLYIDLMGGGTIRSFDCLEEFEDDHCDCVILRIITDIDDYVIAFWWIDSTFMLCRMLQKAIDSAEHSRAFFEGYMEQSL